MVRKLIRKLVRTLVRALLHKLVRKFRKFNRTKGVPNKQTSDWFLDLIINDTTMWIDLINNHSIILQWRVVARSGELTLSRTHQ